MYRSVFLCVSKHERAEGGAQAIRIKRFTEKVFLPARKLGKAAVNKGKVKKTSYFALNVLLFLY